MSSARKSVVKNMLWKSGFLGERCGIAPGRMWKRESKGLYYISSDSCNFSPPLQIVQACFAKCGLRGGIIPVPKTRHPARSLRSPGVGGGSATSSPRLAPLFEAQTVETRGEKNHNNGAFLPLGGRSCAAAGGSRGRSPHGSSRARGRSVFPPESAFPCFPLLDANFSACGGTKGEIKPVGLLLLS